MKKKTMGGSAKAQPMFTGKSSKAGKMVKQYGIGIAKQDKKGFADVADTKKKAKATKQKLNQG